MNSRKSALLSFFAFTLVQLPAAPRAIGPISLPGVGVPGVVRQPFQLPSMPVAAIPGRTLVLAPAAIVPVVSDRQPRESVSDMLRRLGDDAVARERMGDVFDNARRPSSPLLGR